MLSDLKILSQIQVVESVCNANIPETTSSGMAAPGMEWPDGNSSESAYQWWLGDLGFQFLPTYNDPFQTAFDQQNPLLVNMDESLGSYLTDSL